MFGCVMTSAWGEHMLCSLIDLSKIRWQDPLHHWVFSDDSGLGLVKCQKYLSGACYVLALRHMMINKLGSLSYSQTTRADGFICKYKTM